MDWRRAVSTKPRSIAASQDEGVENTLSASGNQGGDSGSCSGARAVAAYTVPAPPSSPMGTEMR